MELRINRIRINRTQPVKREEHWIQMTGVSGSMLSGVTLLCWIYLFSRSKACYANIPIIVSLGYFVK